MIYVFLNECAIKKKKSDVIDSLNLLVTNTNVVSQVTVQKKE